MTDLGALALFATVLAGAVGLGELLRARAGWTPESSRRAVHAVTALGVAVSAEWFEEPTWLYVLGLVFIGVNAVAVPRRWLAGMHGIRRTSWGTVIFPVAFVVALVTCWTLDPGRVYILQVAFVVLGLADPAASYVGTSMTRPGVYRIGDETKSAAGSIVFITVAVLASGVTLLLAGPPTLSPAHVLGGAVVVGVLTTVVEALGRRGWDNLWIVLAVIVPLSALDARPGDVGLHLAALGVAAAFGALAYRARSLDLGGALGATVLAWMVVAVGGPAWAAPAFTFFALSSALSRLGRRRKTEAEALAEKGSRRDIGQVVANGGVGAACLAAYGVVPSPLLFGAFVGAFAAAAADTWATEIGTLARSARVLLVGRRVPPGTSGGMSVVGTVGGVLGAASVVGAVLVVTGAGPAAVPWALGVVGAGVGGSAVDSVLGATLQARFAAPDGTLTERPSADGSALPLAAGRRWLTNDGVNAACTTVGAGLGAVAAALLS